MIKLALASLAALAISAAAVSQAAQGPAGPAQPAAGDPNVVCKYVVAAGRARDNKPYQLCQSPQAWAAKAAADAKDSNRMICHYEEVSGSRLKVGKQCQTADKWAQDELEARQHVEEIQARTCQGQGPC